MRASLLDARMCLSAGRLRAVLVQTPRRDAAHRSATVLNWWRECWTVRDACRGMHGGSREDMIVNLYSQWLVVRFWEQVGGENEGALLSPSHTRVGASKRRHDSGEVVTNGGTHEPYRSDYQWCARRARVGSSGSQSKIRTVLLLLVCVFVLCVDLSLASLQAPLPNRMYLPPKSDAIFFRLPTREKQESGTKKGYIQPIQLSSPFSSAASSSEASSTFQEDATGRIAKISRLMKKGTKQVSRYAPISCKEQTTTFVPYVLQSKIIGVRAALILLLLHYPSAGCFSFFRASAFS